MKKILSIEITEILKIVFTIVLLLTISFATISGCGGDGGDDDDSDTDTGMMVGDDDDDAPEPPVGDDDDDDDDDPAPGAGNVGSISGRITAASGAPLNAVHVRAVNIANSSIQIATFSGTGSDNIPARQLENSKLSFEPTGVYQIDNVPPGSYKVLIEKMDSRSSAFDPARYSSFLEDENPPIAFPDEYYNGADESGTDTTTDFVPVDVVAGEITSDIDIITNN